MSKIFVFINDINPFGIIPIALSEDGEVITSHVCSNENFVKHDMGLNSNWKHKVYDEYYPEGWELEYIEDIETALEENNKFKKAMEKAKED